MDRILVDVGDIRSSIEIFSAAGLPPNLTRVTKRDMVGDDRDFNRDLQCPIIEPPVCTLNIATQIIDWGLWTDQHRAAQGIASEESALWSFENLYAGKIKGRNIGRSEEHTSELQSLMRISYAVFCLKKKKTQK